MNKEINSFIIRNLNLSYLKYLIPFLISVIFSGCIFPPDLSQCTRFEIKYHPSAYVHFIRVSNPSNLLSKEENDFIKSLDYYILTDRERIKEFASTVNKGKFNGFMFGNISYLTPVYFDGFRNDKHIISFFVFEDKICIKDRRLFKYPKDLLKRNLEKLEPIELKHIKLRVACDRNLEGLFIAGPLYRLKIISYPDPNKWCDVILRDRSNTTFVSEEKMLDYFYCPSAGEGKCHYAMNPNCKPDSPGDMVLLFETEAGWNQHGGPELFTFDNHDPKGGCVLLNDGTVKFIRTKEELNNLRWK